MNETTNGEAGPRRYEVSISEPAETEASEAYLWLSQHRGPEFAGRWYRGLLDAIAGLSTFPRLHPIARENDCYDTEVRRLLYKPDRSSGTAYRVLFYVVEPVEEGTGSELGMVRVLHVYHGARES